MYFDKFSFKHPFPHQKDLRSIRDNSTWQMWCTFRRIHLIHIEFIRPTTTAKGLFDLHCI